MSNPLTGKYDAVAQIRVETVNRILSLLHARGASDDAELSFPHTVAIWLDEVGAEIKQALVSEYGDWVSTIPCSWSVGDLRIAENVPPGAAQLVTEMNAMVAELREEVTTPLPLRGTAQVQLSSPTVEVPNGSTFFVAASIQLRAHFTPDPGTETMPEPIHGILRMHFSVEIKTVGDKTVLEEKLIGDHPVRFYPAAGTISDDDAKRVETKAREIIESAFNLTAELNQDFPFKLFKGLGSGPDAVLALPIQLAPPFHLPANGLSGLTNSFLNPADDFVIAVSKEHVESRFADLRSSLSDFEYEIKFSVWVVYLFIPVKHTLRYKVKVTKVHDLKWSNGEVEFEFDVSIKGPGVNVKLVVTQRLGVALDVEAQILKIQRIGLPDISGVPRIVPQSKVNQAEANLAKEIDYELKNSQVELPDLKEDLQNFESLLSASYKSVQITVDGLIINGDLSMGKPGPVVVEFHERGNSNSYSALQSWIPGGSIDRFEWFWVTQGPPLQQKNMMHIDEHRFIADLGGGPDEPSGAHQLCLRVVGKQFVGGAPQYVVDEEGEGCQVSSPGPPVFQMPYWWEKINSPIWGSNPAPWELMDNAIAAHVNTLAYLREPNAPAMNALVHFVDDTWQRPLETLGPALLHSTRPDGLVGVFLVLPRGSFHQPRSEFEQRLGSLDENFAGLFEVTEDYEGAWTRMFGVEKTPATYLMNARGEYVWQHVGPLEPAALKAALDEHLTSSSQPASRTLRLTVRPGDDALNFTFQDSRGRRSGFRRFRGRRVLLIFWKSWSTPCIRELLRLQRLHEQAAEPRPVVLAINDGEDRQLVAKVNREHNFTFQLVPDPHRRISLRYRVDCWPTTVSVDEQGRIDGIHFGMTHDRSSGRGEQNAAD